MKSAADYLAQFNIKLDFNNTVIEPKYPFIALKDRKDMKKIEQVLKEIRPNYPEYDNMELYKDDHCSTWVHVCEATFEKGITPVKYVPQQLPLKDIQYIEENETDYDIVESDTSSIGSM